MVSIRHKQELFEEKNEILTLNLFLPSPSLTQSNKYLQK